MGDYFNGLPDVIKEHIQEITKTSGLPNSDESTELIAQAWLEKRDMFEEQVKVLHLVEVESLSAGSPKAALMLTYSGSLVSTGVPEKDNRWAEYASIGLRKDVPDIAGKMDAKLSGQILLDRGIEFENGPIKKSSPLLKIAVCAEGVSPSEQNNRIREATIFLTNGFVKINRSLISADENYPEQFTGQTMVAYLAAKNGMTKKDAKQLLDDYTTLLETGALLGERVPLGRLGKIWLKKRPAQKARVGRNPATGEEITIKAKPEMYVPAFSFSKTMKEKASSVRVEQD
jgi:nucleoid DNA-binding protein